jgi:phenol 2-monooxygenase
LHRNLSRIIFQYYIKKLVGFPFRPSRSAHYIVKTKEMEPVDVLICGGGPVGLLIGYCLARYGLSTYVAEQHDREKQMLYGRAAMIAPRCLEMLEQLDLVDHLLQIGFVVRGQVSYKDGQRVEMTTHASSNISGTFYDYLLLCRQKYTEEVFHGRYMEASGGSAQYGVKLLSYHVSDGPDDYRVTSTLETHDGAQVSVKSRFIVGADGSRSKVRELAGIRFEGDKTDHHFIRIDGVVKTNMPEARSGLVGIDSPSHGSVLWACLDHGITRVGFAFPKKLWTEKGANVTQEDVIREAKKALQPFILEFKTVEWWTAYSVGQRLASDYRVNDRVLIAGDAAHTHSSAAAQGMNTGIHDAVNLSWKLAGLAHGWCEERVLDSYTTERRASARRVIELDSVVAVLTAGEVPKQYLNDPEFDRSETLSKLYKQNQALNSGIGVNYPPDGCTVVDHSSTKDFNVSVGQRAPDVLIQKPGIRLGPVRLYTLFRNLGKFTLLIFCGNPGKTAASLEVWKEYMHGPDSLARYSLDIFQYRSILAMQNDYGSVSERLHVGAFGQVFYDPDGSAHRRYGVAECDAAVAILRSDAIVGLFCRLLDTDAVSGYFAGFVKGKKDGRSVPTQGDIATPGEGAGEVDIHLSNGQTPDQGARQD